MHTTGLGAGEGSSRHLEADRQDVLQFPAVNARKVLGQNITTILLYRMHCFGKAILASLDSHITPHQSPNRIANVSQVNRLAGLTFGWI